MVEFIYLVIFLIIYCMPLIIAEGRDHKNSQAIAALNILLGWTFLGWIIAFVWAYTDNTEKQKEQ